MSQRNERDRKAYREPCTGACCPRKRECVHYDKYLEVKDSGKDIFKYVCDGFPSRCYLNAYKNYIDNGR